MTRVRKTDLDAAAKCVREQEVASAMAHIKLLHERLSALSTCLKTGLFPIWLDDLDHAVRQIRGSANAVWAIDNVTFRAVVDARMDRQARAARGGR